MLRYPIHATPIVRELLKEAQRAGLSFTTLYKVLGISKASLYRFAYHGADPSIPTRIVIVSLTRRLEAAMEAGRLPLPAVHADDVARLRDILWGAEDERRLVV